MWLRGKVLAQPGLHHHVSPLTTTGRESGELFSHGFCGQLSQLAVPLCKVALSYWKEKREKGKREM